MEDIRLYKPDTGTELFVTKSSWLYPSYTLTDDVNIYGELSYSGFWRRAGLVETASKSWIIEYRGFFSRDILVNDNSTGETVAIAKTSAWRGDVTMEFADGQVLSFIREGLFSRTQLWYSGEVGNVLSVQSKLFSYKRPFIIVPMQNVLKNNNYLVLLTFVSIHLILIRRARAAAH
jgi:hypothetical protein